MKEKIKSGPDKVLFHMKPIQVKVSYSVVLYVAYWVSLTIE